MSEFLDSLSYDVARFKLPTAFDPEAALTNDLYTPVHSPSHTSSFFGDEPPMASPPVASTSFLHEPDTSGLARALLQAEQAKAEAEQIRQEAQVWKNAAYTETLNALDQATQLAKQDYMVGEVLNDKMKQLDAQDRLTKATARKEVINYAHLQDQANQQASSARNESWEGWNEDDSSSAYDRFVANHSDIVNDPQKMKVANKVAQKLAKQLDEKGLSNRKYGEEFYDYVAQEVNKSTKNPSGGSHMSMAERYAAEREKYGYARGSVMNRANAEQFVKNGAVMKVGPNKYVSGKEALEEGLKNFHNNVDLVYDPNGSLIGWEVKPRGSL